jgi:hypothetical protein
MRSFGMIASVLFALAVFASVPASSRASLTLTTGIGATHAGNLVTNGSFENGAPADGTANWTYWATGSTQGPVVVPPGWSSSGAPQTYALWGNDGPPNYHINFSAILPDGRIGIYFGNGAPVFVSQPPTFNANATVSFPAAPSFTNNFTNNVPSILKQTIPTDVNVAPSYKLSFWVSGEDAGGFSTPFGGLGIFGLRVSNVLAGDPIQWLSVPDSVSGPLGSSHLFEYTFTPLNPLVPVTLEFINWGHFDLSFYGGTNFTTELVLDDVIVNTVVPEPASIVAFTGIAILLTRRRRARAS